MKAVIVAVVIALATSGCVTVSGARGIHQDRNLLTREEFSQLGYRTAYDAVQLLRPFWLISRGPTEYLPSPKDQPQVFVNDMWEGGLDVLQTIRLDGVREIRFLPIGETVMRFGAGYPSGGIHVRIGGN